MTVKDFIEMLSSEGIELWREGKDLKYRAPKGAMTRELAAEIQNKKPELLSVLKEKREEADCANMLQADAGNAYMPFPLTDVQQAYWIGRSNSYELGNIGCHIYFELENSNLDIPRLNSAWQRLLERHGMLRAVILPDGRQKILPEVPPYSFRIYDLKEQSPSQRDSALCEIRCEMSHQVFDAEKWPCFDIRVSLLDGKVRLHISLDYIFADASSHLLIFHEWYALYENPDAGLPGQDISFRDYIIEQERRKRLPKHARDMEYWSSRIDSFPPAPPLPLAADPNKAGKPEFVRRVFKLEEELWRALKRRGSQYRLTPSAILQAAFAAVLGIWSNSTRFAINLTLFNRENLHPGVNSIVGEFTSLILLEADYSPGDEFRHIARRMQQQMLEDLDHSSVSAVQVLRELARRRGASENMTMPVVFTSTIGYGSDGPGDTEVFKLGDAVYSITQTPQVWIDHQVMEFEGSLMYNWDSVDEIFPRGMTEDMFGAYTELLKRLAVSDEAWLSPPGGLIPADQTKAREMSNQTSAPLSEETLDTIFALRAQAQPDNPALASSAKSFTYRELDEAAREIAVMAHKNGAVRGELIAVVMEKGWEQVVSVLGIIRAGCAYLPVEASLPADRIKYMLSDAGVRLVLTQPGLKGNKLWTDAVKTVEVGDLKPTAAAAAFTFQKANPDELAYVIYTSGSTGFPKGVMISHRGAVNTIKDINRRFSAGPSDVVPAISSLGFDLSVYDIFGTLDAGGCIAIPDAERRIDPEEWLRMSEEYRLTVWNTVPALMQIYIEYLEKKSIIPSHALRLVLLSGDWIPLDLPDRIRSIFPGVRVISLGGATEASIWSIFYPIDEVRHGWKSIPYGYPLDNQRFHVLDSELRDCPDWVPGSLYIAGTGLAMGYMGDPVKTSSSFIVHPKTGERLYRTGDTGRYRPGGIIEFMGREDFQVKIRGHRIELGEIEAVLKQHPGVCDAVAAVNGEAGDRRALVGYVVAPDGDGPDKDSLKSFLAQKLPDYMVPVYYVVLKSLPLTSNGKVDRKALPAPEASGCEESCGYIEPGTDVEKRLALLWAQALDRERVGIRDNFFHIGGDSLIATRLVLKIREELCAELSLPKLFDAPTVEQLASLIENSRLAPRNIQMELLTSEELYREAELDESITAEGRVTADVPKPSHILLTGATGFLGAFLLHELLINTAAKIYCLVRAGDRQEGMDRLVKNLDRYGLELKGSEDRIIILPGDLSLPMLGLSERDYEYVSNTVEVIYHNGALVHFLYPYSVMKPVNVHGTKEVLRLACASRVKPVHYISTITVFSEHGANGTRFIREDENIDDSGILDTGYAQSKWVAEKLVWTAKSRGIPVTVYRPGQVLGYSVNGACNLDDFIFRIMKGSLQIGAYPPVDGDFNALAADDMSRAIVGLSLRSVSAGRVFHLLHPKSVPIGRIIDWIKSKGHALEEVSWDVWMSRLSASGHENVLFPLLPMFPENMEEETEDGQLVFCQDMTLKELNDMGMSFHEIDDCLFEVYYSYFIRSGYLKEGVKRT